MESIRVVVADDETLVRQSLAQSLNAEPDIEVVGVASDSEQALYLCRQHLPDVVLMDLKMPRMDEIEATKRIKREIPSVKFCILTIYDDDLLLFDALRAGAKGYVLKDATPQQVAEAVRIVASGSGTLSPKFDSHHQELVAMPLKVQLCRLNNLHYNTIAMIAGIVKDG